MSSKVSILIPCYNAESTIDRAIMSVFNQNFQDLELIVIDDGSTDNSKRRILAWKSKFTQKGMELIYLYQENEGPGSAINTGLKYVTGDFLMLLDADDEYLPGAISTRIQYFESNPKCTVVRSNGWRVCKDQKFLFVYDEGEKWRKDVFSALLRGETNNWAGSYMVRTDVLFEFYPDREIYTSRYGQNLQILLPALYYGESGFIDQPLMNYILQENSLSQTSNSQISEQKALANVEGFRSIREHMVDVIVKDPDEKQQYLTQIRGAYWRSIMYIALEHRNKLLMKHAAAQMRQFELFAVQDKIAYYRAIFPPAALGLRVWHKFKTILHR